MSLIFIIITALRIYEMLILVRILLSWVHIDPGNKIIEFLINVTDPVLAPAREVYMRLIQKLNVQVPLDLSPILVFILISLLERTLISFIY